MTRFNSFIFAFILIAGSPALAQYNTAATSDGIAELLIGIFTFILVGAVIGWLARRLFGGSGTGFWGDALFGISGSLLADYVTTEMGIWAGEVTGGLIAAAIGAIALILTIRLIRRAV